MKKLFAAILAAVIFLLCFQLPLHATVGPFAGAQRVYVDGKPFEVWGVFDDTTFSNFRLQDMAYMLNGTPAQFNIRKIDDDRFDYWIVRGEPYTPTGDELRPIEGYRDEYMGGMLWFDGGFFGYATIGVDGVDEPETAISLFVRGDEDSFYFPIMHLAFLLGFSMDWSRTGYFVHDFHDYYVENTDYVFSTEVNSPAILPTKSIEFLELMMHLSGHWVDNAHFVSPVIDESVVWPVELHFSPDGHGINNISWSTVAPMRPWASERWQLWYPLSIQYFEAEVVELTVTGAATSAWNSFLTGYTPADYFPQRIIINTSGEYIDELIYYIGDVAYHMVRADGRHSNRRYYAEPAGDNGIRLLYVLGRNTFFFSSDGFQIYRSQVQGEQGTSVFSQAEISFDDRILFEFVDTTVERGNIYYYSLWRIDTWGGHNSIQFADEQWQIRVDVNALLGEEECVEVEISEDVEGEYVYIPILEETQQRNRWALPVVLLVAVVLVAFLLKRKPYKT